MEEQIDNKQQQQIATPNRSTWQHANKPDIDGRFNAVNRGLFNGGLCAGDIALSAARARFVSEWREIERENSAEHGTQLIYKIQNTNHLVTIVGSHQVFTRR